MTELTHDQLRRVLVATQFDNCDSLWWRLSSPDATSGDLTVYVNCSDFFAWGCADAEPIETEEDVALLECAVSDCREASGEKFPMWFAELYAARRRNQRPAEFMTCPGEYRLPKWALPLFLEVRK